MGSGEKIFTYLQSVLGTLVLFLYLLGLRGRDLLTFGLVTNREIAKGDLDIVVGFLQVLVLLL